MSLAEQIVESLATGTRLPPQAIRSVRAYPLIVDGHQRRIVPCQGCGDQFGISARAIRQIRIEGRQVLCSLCRKPAKVRVTIEHRSYWLQRFTYPEIVILAEAIWGPREYW